MTKAALLDPRQKSTMAADEDQVNRGEESSHSLWAKLPPTLATDPQASSELVDTTCQQSGGQQGDKKAAETDFWCDVELLADLHRADTKIASRMAQAVTSMPKAGSDFLGFHLKEELGRGAFGRVFLAQQGALANRPVALKISARLDDEPQTLAQLQHTNIVPIYSMHHSGPFRAVCMPYLGSTTLADLLKDFCRRESLPLSGKHIVSTLHDRRHSTWASTASERGPRAEREEGASLAALGAPPSSAKEPASVSSAQLAGSESQAILERLKGFSYVEAVLWMGAKLADGLAHAHERGILHRDLKPANVLLTDEGQPMLLDFNLSQDTKPGAAVSAAGMGGTIPYMAPEHLEALKGEPRQVDARSDIYALGLILFELLTGRQAFPNVSGRIDDLLPAMIGERKVIVPALRCCNKAVSPAVEAIVQHCLQPDPARRYQSAHDLREDLDRQLADLSLKHVPEPSLRERLGKWARRHPRLTSSTSIAVVAGLLLAALSLGHVSRQQRLAKLEALDRRHRFVEDAKAARLLLNKLEPDRKDLEEGSRLCGQALERYGINDNRSWGGLPAVRLLPAGDQEQLKDDVGEILMTWARALLLQAQHEKDQSKRQAQAGLGLRLNMLAEVDTAGRPKSKALWLQRAELKQFLGEEQEARKLRAAAEKLQPQSVRDYYCLAIGHSDRREFDKAIPLLRHATRLDPENFWAWFYLGFCHGELLETQAEYCYTTCIALSANSRHAFYPYFNRGLEYLKRQNYEAACADFDRAIQLRPDCADAFINRALARKELGRAELAAGTSAKTAKLPVVPPEKARRLYSRAESDLTQALKLNSALSRAYLIRAAVREQLGEAQAAKNDRDLGMRIDPTDAPTWIDRGLARLAADPKGALADFDRALELSPRSHVAMQNKAHVLAERLGRPQEALDVLNKCVTLYPGFVYARIGRGVLLARLGKRADAHADARASLAMDNKASTYYQAANIYALTSRQNPEDRCQAFPLLSIALQGGFGLDVIDQDADMDPIRTQADFIRLQKAARELRMKPPSQPR